MRLARLRLQQLLPRRLSARLGSIARTANYLMSVYARMKFRKVARLHRHSWIVY